MVKLISQKPSRHYMSPSLPDEGRRRGPGRGGAFKGQPLSLTLSPRCAAGRGKPSVESTSRIGESRATCRIESVLHRVPDPGGIECDHFADVMHGAIPNAETIGQSVIRRGNVRNFMDRFME